MLLDEEGRQCVWTSCHESVLQETKQRKKSFRTTERIMKGKQVILRVMALPVLLNKPKRLSAIVSMLRSHK